MQRLVAIFVLLFGATSCSGPARPLPIIDMHMHAQPADANGPPPLAVCAPFPQFMTGSVSGDGAAAFMRILKNPACPDPIWSPETDDGVMNATLEVMHRRNIIGVVSGAEPAAMARVQRWHDAAPGRVIPALTFKVGPNCEPRIDGRCLTPDDMGRLHAERQFSVLGEVAIQYDGIGPSDEAFEPYLALV